jgi:hypothetical protein
VCFIFIAVRELDRKTRFCAGFLFVVLIYSLPIAGLAVAGILWPLAIVSACFLVSVYMVYRITIKNVKLKYPIVNPEGHPDIYSGRMPRPVYEDVERYPWFFNKRKHVKKIKRDKKASKRH